MMDFGVNLTFCLVFFQAEDGIRYCSVTGVQMCVFFFSSRRRHTRLVSDWSSDVCSSDLRPCCRRAKEIISRGGNKVAPLELEQVLMQHPAVAQALVTGVPDAQLEIGRASCRERVEISVVAVSLKKKRKRDGGGNSEEHGD